MASHAAGAALAITDREEILGVAARGMADVASAAPVRPETRFQIGSISKSFAAIVAMQEVDAGRLDLHVSVNELLPWLGLPEPFGPITMHHLLTHTAGLHTGTEDAPGFAGALHLLRSSPATSAPGERYRYSNDGYKIVGAVLEAVTGLPIHELLRDRLLGPLGMTASVAAITDDIWTDHAIGYEPMLHRSTGPAPASARSRSPDRVEHRRRLDRLQRGGHVRVRAAAARARRPARRTRGPDPVGGGLRAPDGGGRRRRRARTVRVRALERGRRRTQVARPLRWHGRVHGAPHHRAGGGARLHDAPERRGRQASGRRRRARRGARRPRR